MLYALLGDHIFYATNVALHRCLCKRIALNSGIQYFMINDNNVHVDELEVHDLKAFHDPKT